MKDATFEQQNETVVISLGKQLDISDHSLFSEVGDVLELRRSPRIVIDFRKTRTLFDSGVGVLLMLHDLVKPSAYPIRLVNCSSGLKAKLMGAKLPTGFAIASS